MCIVCKAVYTYVMILACMYVHIFSVHFFAQLPVTSNLFETFTIGPSPGNTSSQVSSSCPTDGGVMDNTSSMNHPQGGKGEHVS